jgi:hypothetical protein
MRALVVAALLAGAILPLAGTQSAEAGRSYHRGYRSTVDCTPTNGPYGFYGNLWCDPGPSSYLRNLSAQWPQPVPPSLRYPKPYSNYND